jgi:hypothetical protein
MRRLTWTAVFVALLVLPSSALAAHFDIVYPKLSVNEDPRNSFPLAVLALALEEMRADYAIRSADTVMDRGRALLSLENDDGINVYWTSMSAEVEARLRPVRLPIYRGLIGQRLLIINKNRQADFDRVRSLHDLRQFTAGQGFGWADTKILEAAGLKVESGRYDLLFKQVQQGRIDYFPRGTTEAFSEVEAHRGSEPDLAVERHLLIAYPSDLMFFTSKANEALAATIERGMRAAYDDGSYMRLFNAHPFVRNALEEADLDNRIRIELPNPLLSDEDRAIPARFWYGHHAPK